MRAPVEAGSLIGPHLQAFFAEHLLAHKRASPQTIAAYRDTMRLLLTYVHQRTGKPPQKLDWDDLTAGVISAFLSPRWNRRTDDYGGTTQRRTLLARRVLRAVRAEAGPGMAVTAKLNMTDGVRGGLQPAESVEVARILEAEGALDALELSYPKTSAARRRELRALRKRLAR